MFDDHKLLIRQSTSLPYEGVGVYTKVIRRKEKGDVGRKGKEREIGKGRGV